MISHNKYKEKTFYFFEKNLLAENMNLYTSFAKKLKMNRHFNFSKKDTNNEEEIAKINNSNSNKKIRSIQLSKENTQALFLKPINIYLFHQIDTIKLFRCEDHFIHIECLSNLINNKSSGFKCPTCQKIYGIMIGDMPPGKMKVTLDKKNKCFGYPKEETIVIDYYFKNGKKDGNYYTGTERRSYLPNNKEGREILAMLKIAFDRKLTFTVGTSTTTGQENTVVWNGIHHKTSLRGGAKNHGYPDPTYFSRVTQELAAKGIIKDEFGTGELEGIAINLLYNN